MKNINWKQKLSSRKFWAYLASFIASILYVFGKAETEVAQIVGIITAFGAMSVFVLTEGKIDAESVKVKDE